MLAPLALFPLLLACQADLPLAPAPAVAPPAPGPVPGPSAGRRPPGPPGPPPGGALPATSFHATPEARLEGEVAAHPRSIVLISLDTVSAPHLGVYGGRAETPVLAGMAAAGARFDQALTHFPETCLSHWSMISGVPPEAHGNAPANRGSRSTLPTLPEIAGQHGYATAAFIGGVTLTDASCGFGRGFDRIDDRFPLDRDDMKRPGDEVTRRAATWIRAQEGPYVAFVHYFDAHFPYTPAPPWDTRYDPDYDGSIDGTDAVLRPYRDGQQTPSARDVAHVAALYDGELSELDARLAPVLAAAGPEAIVLVTADHGESFGHDYWFNHRAGLWDEVLRVPLILRGPGVPAGATVDAQVGLVDVTPTLLDLAGLPHDPRVAGRSLVPLLRGEGAGREPLWATTDPWLGPVQRARRTPAEKLVLRAEDTLRYDLARDPDEARPRETAGVDRAAVEAAYAATLAPFTALQAPAPVALGQSPEEAARLEALGYQVPAGGGPPGPPPAGQGPPGPPPRP